MATVRRKEKASKKARRSMVSKGFADMKKKLRMYDTDVENLDEKTNGSAGSDQTSYMSLDVLAQVASETLEKEPKLLIKSPRKMSKRSIQALDILNLEQIQALSDKALLSFFSDMTCNEMTRNFTYQCFLMPEKCQEKYTSFGNENRARLRMRSHLLSHIAQLIDEANDPDRQYQFIFTAEPVHIRNKKLAVKDAEKISKRSKKASLSNNSHNTNSSRTVKGVDKNFTSLKPSKGCNSENRLPSPKKAFINLGNIAASPKKNNVAERKRSFNKESQELECTQKSTSVTKKRKLSRTSSPTKKNMARRYAHKQAKRQQAVVEYKKKLSLKKSIKSIKRTALAKEKLKIANTSASKSDIDSDENSLHDETERRIEENEQFIIDLLSRTQPHHDHCYTTIFGKKRGIETMHFDLDSEDEDSDSIIDVGDSNSYYGNAMGKRVVPILLFKKQEEDTPMVVGEEFVDAEDDENYGHCGEKPYPPMPKSALAKKGKISVPEENESFSEGEEETLVSKKKKNSEKDITAEWERRMALRCIRELKCRKKDDKIPLVCQICLDKTFTASATLMYHYRSHAGIKPFVCLLCNTTFTRQHSLNYHMLIHNNQSRFTCKDCGRKFRHPSHFKEHLRRHTGETPFECNDCPQKFKTRNTYKRHLKTRHGKLLTATGIHVLTKEEFMKVRTKPYKKASILKGVLEQEPREILPKVCSSFSTTVLSPTAVTAPVAAPTTTPVSDQQSLYVPIGILVNT